VVLAELAQAVLHVAAVDQHGAVLGVEQPRHAQLVQRLALQPHQLGNGRVIVGLPSAGQQQLQATHGAGASAHPSVVAVAAQQALAVAGAQRVAQVHQGLEGHEVAHPVHAAQGNKRLLSAARRLAAHPRIVPVHGGSGQYPADDHWLGLGHAVVADHVRRGERLLARVHQLLQLVGEPALVKGAGQHRVALGPVAAYRVAASQVHAQVFKHGLGAEQPVREHQEGTLTSWQHILLQHPLAHPAGTWVQLTVDVGEVLVLNHRVGAPRRRLVQHLAAVESQLPLVDEAPEQRQYVEVPAECPAHSAPSWWWLSWSSSSNSSVALASRPRSSPSLARRW
jgi:hypothetical protein